MVQKKARSIGPIPFHRPSIDKDDLQAVEACLRSGWLTTGPRTEAFEQAFSKFVGAKYAVGVNSCTAALHLALLALGVGPGDEVITSPITFVSTVNVILHVGAKPVFADVFPDDLTIDPQEIEAKITRRTRAIIPVHFAGHPCEMREIFDIARRKKIPIISDAAHAVEARFEDEPSGKLGDIVCYSFYANKNMTTGEGGMAVTDDPDLADRIRILRLHGMSRDAWNRYGKNAKGHWDLLRPGWKYNMSDVQAALGLSQLSKLGEWHERRIQLADEYDHLLQEVPGIGFLEESCLNTSAKHLQVIRVERLSGMTRDRLMERLRARGIGVGVHFRAVHLTKFYRSEYGFRRGVLPVAEKASDEVLSLPLYPAMTDGDVARVSNAVAREMNTRGRG